MAKNITKCERKHILVQIYETSHLFTLQKMRWRCVASPTCSYTHKELRVSQAQLGSHCDQMAGIAWSMLWIWWRELHTRRLSLHQAISSHVANQGPSVHDDGDNSSMITGIGKLSMQGVILSSNGYICQYVVELNHKQRVRNTAILLTYFITKNRITYRQSRNTLVGTIRILHPSPSQ